MQLKISILDGDVLDFVVSCIERWGVGGVFQEDRKRALALLKRGVLPRPYSRDFALAGPIILREGIDLHQHKHRPYITSDYNARTAARAGAQVIGRALLVGPGRAVREPRVLGPNEGKWFARLAIDSNPFGWTVNDCMSDTPMLAAMRCHAKSVLGDYAEVDDDVVKILRDLQAARAA